MGIDVVTLALAKGYTDGKIRDVDCGKIKNPDWNQNDETAPDYIKNKPIEETEDDALEMLAEMGIVDPMTDEEGSILTDENGNILII